MEAVLGEVDRACWPTCWRRTRRCGDGADEAVFVEDGVVSECSASNLFVVRGGKLITHPVGPKVLPGITRAVLQQVAKRVRRRVGRAGGEARRGEESADEVFITSTTREISWVGTWDGKTVGGGRCGPVTLKLHRALRERVVRETSSLVGAA